MPPNRDDDKTPPLGHFRRKQRPATNTEMDLAMLRAAREKKAADALTALQRVSPPDFIEREDTSRIELLGENEALRMLFAKSEKIRAELAAARSESANRDLEIAGERPPEDRFAALEKNLRFWKWVLTAIAIPAISSLILVGKYLYTKGQESEAARIEAQHMHDQVLDHEQRIRELEKPYGRRDTAPRVNP